MFLFVSLFWNTKLARENGLLLTKELLHCEAKSSKQCLPPATRTHFTTWTMADFCFFRIFFTFWVASAKKDSCLASISPWMKRKPAKLNPMVSWNKGNSGKSRQWRLLCYTRASRGFFWLGKKSGPTFTANRWPTLLLQGSYSFELFKSHDFPWSFPWLFLVFHDLKFTCHLRKSSLFSGIFWHNLPVFYFALANRHLQ